MLPDGLLVLFLALLLLSCRATMLQRIFLGVRSSPGLLLLVLFITFSACFGMLSSPLCSLSVGLLSLETLALVLLLNLVSLVLLLIFPLFGVSYRFIFPTFGVISCIFSPLIGLFSLALISCI